MKQSMDHTTGNFQPLGNTQQESSSVKRNPVTLILLICILIMSSLAFAYALKAYNNNSGLPAEPTEPHTLTNLASEKQKIKDYYARQYDTDLYALVGVWKNYFDGITPTEKSLVIFDIDDTLLFNYPSIVLSDFGFIPWMFDAWVDSARAPAINQTKGFLEYLQKRGFKVLAITGRNYTQDYGTRQNFINVGISGFQDIIYRTLTEQPPMTATVYKSNRRMQLTQTAGWNIVGCCGDQISDCAGGYAGYIMKVPNYCYFLP
jgi:predicted secreted acid phosphatase